MHMTGVPESDNHVKAKLRTREHQGQLGTFSTFLFLFGFYSLTTSDYIKTQNHFPALLILWHTNC